MQIRTVQNLLVRTILHWIMTTTLTSSGGQAASAVTATSMKNIFAKKQKGQWNGRLISRILPPSISGDYDIRAKPSSSVRIDPSELRSGTGPFSFKPWSSIPPATTTTTHSSKEEEDNINASKKSSYSDWKTIWSSNPSPQSVVSSSQNQNKNGEGTTTEKGSSLVLDVYLFNCEEQNVTHHIRLNRDSTESIDKTLKRLEISIAKKLLKNTKNKSKKTKKQKHNASQSQSTYSQVWKKNTSIMDKEDVSLWDVTTDGQYQLSSHVLENANAIVVSLKDGTNSANTNTVATAKDGSNRQHQDKGGGSNTMDTSSALCLLDIPLQVEHCNPTILSVKTFENFESRIFAGVPIVVEVDIIYANHVVIDWYVDKATKVCSNSHVYIPTSQDIGKQLSIWIKPIKHCEGGDIAVGGEGCEEAYEFLHGVEPLPSMPTVTPLRQEWTTTRKDQNTDKDGANLSSTLRVVSYNILADQNVYSRDGSLESVYPYCPTEYLDRTRRMPMIVYELLAYQPDLICLQEVDMLSFDTLLRPVLNANGYQGYYSVKQVDSSHEGCALFWSLRCFEKIRDETEMNTFAIRDLFPPLPNDSNAGDNNTSQLLSNENDLAWKSLHELSHFLTKHKHLQETVQKTLGHILQLVTLTLKQPKNGSSSMNESSKRPPKIVAANTHLFFHSWAGHIRIMQLLVSCHKLDTYRRIQHENNNDSSDIKYPFVFCGDFNADAVLSGGARLILHRSVPPANESWDHLHSFEWRKEQLEEGKEYQQDEVNSDDGLPQPASTSLSGTTVEVNADEPPTLFLPDTFPTMCSGYRDLPPFTHYIQGFVGTLDYILASESSEEESFGFRPKRWAPMPSEQQIRQYTALPNEGMPSDHLSLVCDLEYTTSKNE